MFSERILRRLTGLPGVRTLWTRFPFGPIGLRVRYGISQRPQYAYGVHAAAHLASKLGIPAISVIEFGVAGGRGLVALEHIAQEVGRALGIEIAVFGFDGGKGMPAARDYRDLPHQWSEGFYEMDETALRARLKNAHLILGDVDETAQKFLRDGQFPPLGFIAFDLDYYSSTKAAFRILEGGDASRLPRVFCYFDDILSEVGCHNEYVGELCAIREFNEDHTDRKIAQLHMLSHMRAHPETWNEQTYVLHDFNHPLYCVNITPVSEQQIRL